MRELVIRRRGEFPATTQGCKKMGEAAVPRPGSLLFDQRLRLLDDVRDVDAELIERNGAGG